MMVRLFFRSFCIVLLVLQISVGNSDIGFHNSKMLSPNMDKLANEGVRLDRFYLYKECESHI
jgi:arylsulfatase A-like enzyme